MDLDTKDDLRLLDHLNKCRCCFEKFNYNEKLIKITDIIKGQFLELTQIELKLSSSYSESVCLKCTNELQSISNIRLDLITKQQQLYDFVTTSKYEIQDAVKFEPVNIKDETQSSDEFGNPYDSESPGEEIEKFEVPGISKTTKTNDQPKALASKQKPKVLKVKTTGKNKLLNKVKKKPNLIKQICPHCGIMVGDAHTLSKHIRRVHLKERNFFCDLCDFSSTFKNAMANHMQIHLSFREKLHCSKCEFETISASKMTAHVNRNCKVIKESVVCFCGKVCSSKVGLNNHIQFIHEQKKDHFCTICDKAYVKPWQLRKHILATHTGIKNVACEICGKMFLDEVQLRKHSIFHEEERFVCSFEGCTKKFFLSSAFKRHEKTHLDQRDFECHLCDKKYFAANHLQRHIANFHKQLKVSCELPGCSSVFARKETYRNHVLSRHKDLSEVEIQLLLKKIREMRQE